MKSCILIPLLCLCITISAGHKARHEGLPLFKRQMQEQCIDIFTRELCTNGYYEDYAHLAARCSQTEAAQNIQDGCDVNAMGRFCNDIEPPDTQSVESACGISPTNCSSECASNLTTIRAELGCCVNAYNTTDLENSDQFVYNSALWSVCDVEPVTEQCASSFDLPTEIDTTCDARDFQELLYSSVLCRNKFFVSLRSALTNGGCSDELATGLASSCSVDGDGRFCILRDDLFDQLDSASMNCPNTSSCSESCIATLNNIVDMSGCCFISQFNNSLEMQLDFLSYEFWQRCGLTSPGFCEVQLSGADLTVGATATLFFLAIFATFN